MSIACARGDGVQPVPDPKPANSRASAVPILTVIAAFGLFAAIGDNGQPPATTTQLARTAGPASVTPETTPEAEAGARAACQRWVPVVAGKGRGAAGVLADIAHLLVVRAGTAAKAALAFT